MALLCTKFCVLSHIREVFVIVDVTSVWNRYDRKAGKNNYQLFWQIDWLVISPTSLNGRRIKCNARVFSDNLLIL